MTNEIQKAKAPVLGLIYNLIFEPSVKTAFSKNPNKICKLFGLSTKETNDFIDRGSDFALEQIKQELDALATPCFIIPHSKTYRSTPTLSVANTLLTNGTVSDLFQPNDEAYRYSLYDAFELKDTNVIKAFEQVKPEVTVISKQIHKELERMVKLDFNDADNIQAKNEVEENANV